MVLLASVGYAFASIWVREKLGGVQPVAVAAATMIVAGIVTLAPAIAAPPEHMPTRRHLGRADRARRRRHRASRSSSTTR